MKAGWRVARVGEICTFNYGKALPESARKGGGTPVFGSNGVVGFHDSSITSGKTIVIGRKGSFGEVHYSEVPSWPIDTAYFVDEASTEQDMRWLFYRLGCLGLNQMNKAAAVPGLNRDDAYRQEILLPPLSEQRRIAAILDKADAQRTKRREALAQLDRLAQSIFVEMFGDPGVNPKAWPLVTLGQLIREKPNNGIFRKNEDYGEGLPVAWVEELFRGSSVYLDKSRRLNASGEEIRKYGLKCGDILFCRSSLKLAGLGYNNVYLGPDNAALFECHVIRISPRHDLVDSEFLNFLLRIPSQRLRLFRFAKTVTMSTIDQEGIKNVEVPVPPLTLQKAFVGRLHAIQRCGAQMFDSTGPLDILFASLQQRAFSGEL